MHPEHGKGLTFSEALEQLKDGRKLQRQGWNGKDQWVVRQNGYPEGIPLNRNTAQATGLPEGSEQKFAPYYMLYTIYSTFVPWTPSPGDLEAADWDIYYMPGEYERLCQEETDAAIAEDPTLAAELEADGKDLRTYSHEEVKMVLALRALEREDIPDREDIRFRLIDRLLKPIFDHQRQLDLANHPLPLETVSPQVASMMNAFVGVITRLSDDLTQTKSILDATHEKIAALKESELAWLDRYPVPDGLNSNDAILAHHRIRYFQDGWDGSPGFTQATWRLISTLMAPMLEECLMAPMLEEWRQSHADTTGNFDLDRFKITFHGARDDGVDTIGHMDMELVPIVPLEQVAAMEKALEALGDPEKTQQLVRPGDPGYPERPQRLTDVYRLRPAFDPAEPFEEDPVEGRRMIRRAAPDAEPTRVVKYYLTRSGHEEVEVAREEWVNAERNAGFRPKGEDVGQPATAGWSSSQTNSSGRIEHAPQ